MPITLKEVVPWGRSFDEYVEMFSLSADDLKRSIVGCGDGPASFNAEMRRMGRRVVSVDPLYQFSAEQIRGRVEEAYRTIIDQLVLNQASYRWTRNIRAAIDKASAR